LILGNLGLLIGSVTACTLLLTLLIEYLKFENVPAVLFDFEDFLSKRLNYLSKFIYGFSLFSYNVAYLVQ